MQRNIDLENLIRRTAQQQGKTVQDVAANFGYAPLMGPQPQNDPAGNVPIVNAPQTPVIPAGNGNTTMSRADRLKQLFDQSNAANEQRYQQELGLNASDKQEQLGALNGQYAQIFGLAGSGVQEGVQREENTRKKNLGDLGASLASRGLFDSTVVDSLDRGVNDDAYLRENDLRAAGRREQEGVRSQYADRLLNQLDGSNNQRIDIIDRRTDQSPDLGLYAQLFSQPAGGGGYGGGGYGGGSGAGGGNFGPTFGNIFGGGSLNPPGFETPSAGANPFSGASGGGSMVPHGSMGGQVPPGAIVGDGPTIVGPGGQVIPPMPSPTPAYSGPGNGQTQTGQGGYGFNTNAFGPKAAAPPQMFETDYGGSGDSPGYLGGLRPKSPQMIGPGTKPMPTGMGGQRPMWQLAPSGGAQTYGRRSGGYF